jgi:hypothetical protein
VSSLDALEPPLSELEHHLAGWTAEAVELRFGAAGDPLGAVGLPPTESGPQQVLESLLRVRSRLDRVEALAVRATRARGRLQRASQAAKAQAGEAWDREIARVRSSPVRRGDEFTGPRERYAEANLATLVEQRTERQSSLLLVSADTAVDAIRQCQRGLDSLRQDHIAVMRSYQFESHLER